MDELARNLVSATDLPEFRHYELAFHVDQDLQRVIVQVLDSETKEVLRSIPPEDVIQALKRLHDSPSGVLIDQEG